MANVERGEALPAREGFAGVHRHRLGAMVTERPDWSERSAAWLRDAAHAGMPLFGICYGHQLLAHALGGEVGYNPAGREMGTIGLELHPHAGDDPLFAGLPRAVPRAGHAPADGAARARGCDGARALAAGRLPCVPLARARLGRAVPSRIQRHPHARLRAGPPRRAAREGHCAKQVAATSRPRRTRGVSCAVSSVMRADCTRAEAFL